MYLVTNEIFWLVGVVTPESNFLVVTNLAVGESRAHALASVCGIIIGTSLWGVDGWLEISLASALCHSRRSQVGRLKTARVPSRDLAYVSTSPSINRRCIENT